MEIKVITYNVNNSGEAVEALEGLCEGSYDLILISVQEGYWPVLLKKFKFTNYAHKYHENIWGLVSIVLSKEKVEVEWRKECFGPVYCGNKGVITCLINKSIIFVSTHLSHGQTNRKREHEFKKIVKDIDLLSRGRVPVVIAGDLNFRMNLEKKSKQIPPQLCPLDLHKNIEKYDQLTPLRNSLGLSEHPIDFLPTYKFKNLKYDKERVPSYCDRILFREIRATSYRSLESFLFSDHKPVVLTGRIENLVSHGQLAFPHKCFYSLASCSIFNYSPVFVIFSIFIIFKMLV